MIEKFQDRPEQDQKQIDLPRPKPRLNPRLVFSDPDRFFTAEAHYELIIEQQEGQG